MAQNRFSQKAKTNKNMLLSLTQIFTQRYQPVNFSCIGSSHSDVFPPKKILPKILEMYSQNP